MTESPFPMLKIVTLLTICAISLTAADAAANANDSVQLNPAASKELKSLAAALAENQKAMEAANLKVMVQAKKNLKKVVDSLLTAKDLDSATAVNSEIKKVDGEIAKLTGMGDVDPIVVMVGQWDVNDPGNGWRGIIVIDKDGNEVGGRHGKVKVDAGKVSIVYAGGHNWEFFEFKDTSNATAKIDGRNTTWQKIR